MADRTPAEILVARLSGVDDPAERVRIVAEALDEAMRSGVEAEREAWRCYLRWLADQAEAEASIWDRYSAATARPDQRRAALDLASGGESLARSLRQAADGRG